MGKDESGAGTALAAGLAVAVLLLMAMVLGLGQAAAAAAKAATAADMAALAAADAYRGVSQGAPCRIAAEVSELHGASLQKCTLAGDLSVQVEVAVETTLPWPAQGKARAGVPPDTVRSGWSGSGIDLFQAALLPTIQQVWDAVVIFSNGYWLARGWLADWCHPRPGVTRLFSDLPRQCPASDMSAWSGLHLSGPLRWLDRRMSGPPIGWAVNR